MSTDDQHRIIRVKLGTLGRSPLRHLSLSRPYRFRGPCALLVCSSRSMTWQLRPRWPDAYGTIVYALRVLHQHYQLLPGSVIV